jgi:hypothetical protein
MMFADLVDQVDLYEALIAQGAPVLESDSVDVICQKASHWLNEQSPEVQAYVASMVADLLSGNNILLPEVRQALITCF